jgi:hypothetical protein
MERAPRKPRPLHLRELNGEEHQHEGHSHDPDEHTAVWVALGQEVEDQIPENGLLAATVVMALYLKRPAPGATDAQGGFEYFARKSPGLRLTDAELFEEAAKELLERVEHLRTHHGGQCPRGKGE